MRKRIFFILSALMLCLCFAFSACNQGGSGTGGKGGDDDNATYYTVTFDSHGGSAAESQSVLEGNTVRAPASPKRDDDVFLGWYKSADENAEQWNFQTNRVNSDITLHAHWQEMKENPTPSETLTFELNSDKTGCIVTGDSGQSTEIVIPAEHENLPVVAIGESAFAYSLVSLFIPISVTKIGNYFIDDSAIAELRYEGTEMQWEQIEKGSLWNLGKADIPITLNNTNGQGSSILIAYFSCTNNTEHIAEYIEEITGGTFYQITPIQPYASADLNYSDRNSRSTKEQNDSSARPEISGSVENMESYDVIFLGYPIWWGQAPKIIYTFLESYDFAGKTIVPFCTSGSSSIGTSATNLHSLASGATWLDGSRFSGSAAKSAVETWINGLGL